MAAALHRGQPQGWLNARVSNGSIRSNSYHQFDQKQRAPIVLFVGAHEGLALATEPSGAGPGTFR